MRASYIDYQNRFTIRAEWGLDAIESLYDTTDVFIIVDILSFSTCVDIAVSRGAAILPYRFKDASAGEYAAVHSAELATPRSGNGRFTLSPVSMQTAEAGMKIVLPSPNGATLSMRCRDKVTFCGCLRNATAVAMAAQQLGDVITVVAAGERWENGNIRFALEDALGAGAIIAALNGTVSSEAEALKQLWKNSRSTIETILADCTSGNELIGRDYREDVRLAAETDVSTAAPQLYEECYYRDSHR